ncbi:dimethyladenosine transferase 2, mitochondrial [Copidosoma floridanum]|uniref:dimethyladenosine transferase 2, mitochondrial n=1 Tax=Copidosoma floridanum TaxID=29053 RepID=UPI0006C95E1A|nr:dimethyladenosine transferase 2, mitochondrial [Copidosoma floridanum]
MLCRSIWRTRHFHTSSFQKSSTAENVELPVEKTIKKPQKRPSRPATVYPELINHLKENNYLNFIPTKFLGKRKSLSLHLINRDTAKQFCSMIEQDLLQNTSHVIENNSGLGILTEELLKIGVPKINMFEKNRSFLTPNSPLQSLLKDHKSRLSLKELNFTDIWAMAIRDNFMNENLTGHYLTDVPHNDWKSKTNAQIILFASDRTSIVMLIYNLVHETSLFCHGRPVFYFAVSSETWDRLNVLNDSVKLKRFYTQFNVFLKLFFDSQILGEVPRTSFIPWPVSRVANKDMLSMPMKVVKVEPKKNAFQSFERENLRAFWFFLKHCLRSSKIKVIQEIESFAPGCGAKFIEKNIDITTTFKELPPQKLLEIFQIYKSCPEYDENSFLPNPRISEDTKSTEDEKLEGEVKQSEEFSSEPKIEQEKDLENKPTLQLKNEEDKILETFNEDIKDVKSYPLEMGEKHIFEPVPKPKHIENGKLEWEEKHNLNPLPELKHEVNEKKIQEPTLEPLNERDYGVAVEKKKSPEIMSVPKNKEDEKFEKEEKQCENPASNPKNEKNLEEKEKTILKPITELINKKEEKRKQSQVSLLKKISRLVNVQLTIMIQKLKSFFITSLKC